MASRIVTLALVVPLVGLSGCIVDSVPDSFVYFDNGTEETLYLRVRDPVGSNPARKPIEPKATTAIMLVPENECGDLWVIIDRDDNVVKDPGKICWHDTVSIP